MAEALKDAKLKLGETDANRVKKLNAIIADLRKQLADLRGSNPI
jgi:hypothetical protein